MRMFIAVFTVGETIQRPVAGWHLPSSISLALQNTLHEFLEKMTLHPLSHSCLAESSEE